MQNADRKLYVLSLFVSLFLHVFLFWSGQARLPEQRDTPTVIYIEQHKHSETPSKTTAAKEELGHHSRRSKQSRLNDGRNLNLNLATPNQPSSQDGVRSGDDAFDTSENEALRPAEWERTRTFQERIDMAPFINELGKRIDSHLVYGRELISNRHEGVVRVALITSNEGKIRKLESIVTDASPQLTGWVLKTVRKALERPIKRSMFRDQIQTTLEFSFHISHVDDILSTRNVEVLGNTIRFHREGKLPSRFDLTIHTSDNNLWTRIFNKAPQDETRSEWDLNYRQAQAERVCETQRASGACYEAGKTALLLGNTSSAVKWFKIACDEQIEDACRLLKENSSP